MLVESTWTGDQVGQAALRKLQASLRPPESHLAPRVLMQTAERFVFDENPYEVVSSLVGAGQVDTIIPVRTARAPTTVSWIEWPAQMGKGEHIKLGALLDQNWHPPGNPNQNMLILALGRQNSIDARPVAVVYVSAMPFQLDANGGFNIGVRWALGTTYDEVEGDLREVVPPDIQRELMILVYEWVDALFLLTVPRACELREARPSTKLQKARARAGKLPLVEVKRVVLRIGRGAPRYARSTDPSDALGSDARDGRRLHAVMGHMRTYEKGRSAPLVTWVPEHWRGDAELGVVLHEREVRR
jgi:hypothetical protein